MRSFVNAAMIISSVAISATAFGAAENNPGEIDLTSYFAGIEKNCAEGNRLTEAILTWMAPDQKGRLPSIKSTAANLRPILMHTKVEESGESWSVSAMLANANYKGIPVTRIDRWTGKNNGISGFSLVFAESLATVSKKLRVAKRDKNSEEPGPELYGTSGKGKRVSSLVCDFSN